MSFFEVSKKIYDLLEIFKTLDFQYLDLDFQENDFSLSYIPGKKLLKKPILLRTRFLF